MSINKEVLNIGHKECGCSYRPDKTYYLIYMYFGDFRKGEKNRYFVYKYRKNRRYSRKQAWKFIRGSGENADRKGLLTPSATVDSYWDIVKKIMLDDKMCDMYIKFGYLK